MQHHFIFAFVLTFSTSDIPCTDSQCISCNIVDVCTMQVDMFHKVLDSQISTLVGNNCFAWLFLAHTHTQTRLTALFPGLPGWAGTKGKANLDFTEARDSEWHQLGHASLHLTPDRQPRQHPRPDALPAAQPTASKHWRPMVTPGNRYYFPNSFEEMTK